MSERVTPSSPEGDLEFYTMKPDGTDVRQLTSNTVTDYIPACSPDGRKIVFRSDRDGDPEIFVMNAGGTAQTRLTNNTRGDHRPIWSPSGRQIAFRSDRDGEIYVMNADGSEQRNLTNNPAQDHRPSRSQSGCLAFESDRAGNEEICTTSPTGANPIRVTSSLGRDCSPTGHPTAYG